MVNVKTCSSAILVFFPRDLGPPGLVTDSASPQEFTDLDRGCLNVERARGSREVEEGNKETQRPRDRERKRRVRGLGVRRPEA